MNWDEIKKLDYREICLIVQEARAELMYEALRKSRNLSDWAQYLKDHPPSPETLAVLVGLGLEQFQSRSGRLAGLESGRARRKTVRCTPEVVAKEYQTLMATGTEERNIAAKLATRFKVTSGHIRKLRNQANNQT